MAHFTGSGIAAGVGMWGEESKRYVGGSRRALIRHCEEPDERQSDEAIPRRSGDVQALDEFV